MPSNIFSALPRSTGDQEQFSALLREMKRRSAKVVGSGAPGTEQAREAAAWVAAGPRRHVLGSADIMTVCFDAVRMTNLGNRHRTDWLLAGADALKPECRGLSPQIEPFSYTPGP